MLGQNIVNTGIFLMFCICLFLTEIMADYLGALVVQYVGMCLVMFIWGKVAD